MVRDTVWESGGSGGEYGEEEKEKVKEGERHCVCGLGVWVRRHKG